MYEYITLPQRLFRWLTESKQDRVERIRLEQKYGNAERGARIEKQEAIDMKMIDYLQSVPEEDRITWIDRVKESLAYISECNKYSIHLDPGLSPMYCTWVKGENRGRSFNCFDAAKGYCEKHRLENSGGTDGN